MTTATTGPLKRTPFHDKHAALSAKIVPFAGYEMPVQYANGITAEHNAVRQHCGLFDVSHMGEFRITGAKAVEFVNYVTTNDVNALAVGQVHYSTILNERGTIEDDCLVYRFPDKVMMVVNASNKDKDFAHIKPHAKQFGVTLEDISDDMGLLALQGPEAAAILQPLTKAKLADIKYYYFRGRTRAVGSMPNHHLTPEVHPAEERLRAVLHDPRYSVKLWDMLTGLQGQGDAGGTRLARGRRCPAPPRMGMALYGNDIDDAGHPLEANLGWLVKLNKGDFVGSRPS